VPYKDPERMRAYQREYQRMRKAGLNLTPAKTPLPLEFKLQTAQDVIDLLAEQIAAVKQDKEAGTLEKARTVGYLLTIALKAIETANLEARIEALERVLAERKVATA
jgi:hypothetical protein